MSPSLVVRSQRVVVEGGVRPAAVHVRGATIVAVTGLGVPAGGAELVDVADRLLMPGLVDTHVHVNEPGRTDWEGFRTAARAAAAGGVTTIVDMPLNSVPATTTVAALEAKRAAAEGQSVVDVGFWGGVVPGNAEDLEPLLDAGVLGFKCFLVPSGVVEFRHVAERDLRVALPRLARRDAVLLVHAEAPEVIARALETVEAGLTADPKGPPYSGDYSADGRRRYATYLRTRPKAAENEAVAMVLRLAREFGARVHVVHLASDDALSALDEAKRAGTRVSVETCPHYLCFTAEEIGDGATAYKCAPPIRERAVRERLWDGLRGGTIDLVVSDHSPSPPAMKCLDRGDFFGAWGGVSSLQLSLPIVWTEASARGHTVADLTRWMCEAPARLAGLGGRKGTIAPGFDADLVVWDPEAAFQVDPARLHHRHPVTPYAGRRLTGVVETTFVRGVRVYDRGEFCGAPGGVLLTARA